jgi:DNA mismatch repair ATPase MutL
MPTYNLSLLPITLTASFLSESLLSSASMSRNFSDLPSRSVRKDGGEHREHTQSRSEGNIVWKKVLISSAVSSERSDGRVWLIDQHAAHERIRFEALVLAFTRMPVHFRSLRLKDRLHVDEHIETHVCHTPIEFDVPIAERSLETFLFMLRTHSSITRLSPQHSRVVVCAWPALVHKIFCDLGQQAFLQWMVEEIIQAANNTVHKLPDKILKELGSLACRRAVKFGDALSADEVSLLVSDLKDCKFPLHCVHGRNTVYPIGLRWSETSSCMEATAVISRPDTSETTQSCAQSSSVYYTENLRL